MLLNHLLELGSIGTREPFNLLSVLVEDEGGDRGDLEGVGDVLSIIDVNLEVGGVRKSKGEPTKKGGIDSEKRQKRQRRQKETFKKVALEYSPAMEAKVGAIFLQGPHQVAVGEGEEKKG